LFHYENLFELGAIKTKQNKTKTKTKYANNGNKNKKKQKVTSNIGTMSCCLQL